MYDGVAAETVERLPCTEKTPICWSQPINITSAHDCCVRIPGVADVKVHLERISHTVHIYLDPVSRAEISAKEVRSRIRGEETVKVTTRGEETVKVTARGEDTVKVAATATNIESDFKHNRHKSNGNIRVREFSAVERKNMQQTNDDHDATE